HPETFATVEAICGNRGNRDRLSQSAAVGPRLTRYASLRSIPRGPLDTRSTRADIRPRFLEVLPTAAGPNQHCRRLRLQFDSPGRRPGLGGMAGCIAGVGDDYFRTPDFEEPVNPGICHSVLVPDP